MLHLSFTQAANQVGDLTWSKQDKPRARSVMLAEGHKHACGHNTPSAAPACRTPRSLREPPARGDQLNAPTSITLAAAGSRAAAPGLGGRHKVIHIVLDRLRASCVVVVHVMCAAACLVYACCGIVRVFVREAALQLQQARLACSAAAASKLPASTGAHSRTHKSAGRSEPHS